MGADMCRDTSYDEGINLDALSSQFKETKQFDIPHDINVLIDRISTFWCNREQIRQIVDPRNNHQLKTYQSKHYGFKMLGMITWKRPVGECLFYFGHEFIDDQQEEKSSRKKKPLIITTKINSHYMFSNNTLIIYEDNSYYIGQIQAKKYEIPKATGKGLLVSQDFIYQGQFENGYPQGLGKIRTKFLQYTGNIRKGLPYGQCIQKTAKGLFMGRIDQKRKVGFLITPQNKRIEIDQNLKTPQLQL